MEKSIYIVHFEYDNSAIKEEKCCLIRANNKEEAKEVFENNIYKIFFDNDDVCKFLYAVGPCEGDLLYVQGTTVWFVNNNSDRRKIIMV